MSNYLMLRCGTDRQSSVAKTKVDKSTSNRAVSNKRRYKNHFMQLVLVCCMFVICSSVLGEEGFGRGT